MNTTAATTQYAEHQGLLIAYQVRGSGPIDLLLTTGLTSNFEHLTDTAPDVLDHLSRFARLILFDRRGSGHSDALPGDSHPTWEDWADDVRVVLDAVGSTHAALYG
ncbi:MAG: alpha/beta fold hydrolase, partial [Candidatus Binatia bacterium]